MSAFKAAKSLEKARAGPHSALLQSYPDGSESAVSVLPVAAAPILAPWQAKLATTVMAGDLSIAVSIAEIALLCRLSLSHFVRAFSNTLGVTPYAWFMRKRIDHAEALLANSNLPIVQIALECGFSDQAHFTKAFVKATGATPARWRRAADRGNRMRRAP